MSSVAQVTLESLRPLREARVKEAVAAFQARKHSAAFERGAAFVLREIPGLQSIDDARSILIFTLGRAATGQSLSETESRIVAKFREEVQKAANASSLHVIPITEKGK